MKKLMSLRLIWSSIKRARLGYLLFIIAQVITIFSILYFFMVQKERINNQLDDSYNYFISFSVNNDIISKQLFDEILSKGIKNIKMVNSTYEQRVFSEYLPDGGVRIYGGFNKDEINSSRNVVNVNDFFLDQLGKKVGDIISINSQDYIISDNSLTYYGDFEIPYTTFINNKIPMSSMILYLPKGSDEVDFFNTISFIETKIDINSYEMSDVQRMIDDRMIGPFIFSILLFALALVNYLYLYKYILEKRKKYYAIAKLVGCSHRREFWILIIEMISLYTLSFILGLLLLYFSNNMIFPYLFDLESVSILYKDISYIYISLLPVVIIGFIIFYIMFMNLSPIKQLKESEEL